MSKISLMIVMLMVEYVFGQFKCALMDKNGYFDVTDLVNQATKSNGERYFDVGFANLPLTTFRLGLCAPLKPTCGDSGDLIFMQYTTLQCIALLSSKATVTLESKYGILLYYYLDGNEDFYVVYTAKEGDKSLTVEMKCDANKPKENPEFKGTIVDGKFVIQAVIQQACPLFSMTYFYSKYPLPFAIASIAIGVIIGFLGTKIFKVVVFLMATIIVTFIVFSLVYQLVLTNFTLIKSWVVWAVLGGSGLFGLVAGFFAAKYEKFSFVLSGACLGGVSGFIIYTAFLTSVAGSVYFFW